ncbi:hypothetical protein [Nonomuraea sp. NPDC048826]|uniref:hypothetical protein n=1 Tax=Nonomuraea sp. NPDC048826 TaxID=3364347 RepID=UPI00371AA9EA
MSENPKNTENTENTAPEPSQDEVEELIEDLEVHGGIIQPGITDDCTNDTCACTITC